MKNFTDKKQREGEEYRVGDLVLLSTKDLKWQIKGKRSEKLTEHFVGPYKVEGIISSNTVSNFIRPYLHQFFDDSHGLKASLKPLRKPFDRYQSRLKAINNG